MLGCKLRPRLMSASGQAIKNIIKIDRRLINFMAGLIGSESGIGSDGTIRYALNAKERGSLG